MDDFVNDDDDFTKPKFEKEPDALVDEEGKRKRGNPLTKDPAYQAEIARKARTTRNIIEKTVQAMPTPEEEDAQELADQLDPEIRIALSVAKKELAGSVGQIAQVSPLLNIAARHSLIIRLRAQGMHPERIARAVGVTRRTVDKTVQGYFKRAEIDIRNQSMDQFVLLMAEGYLEDIDRLTEVIANSRHAGGIVGAIRARQEARQKYVDLLADFGFLNRKPTEVHVSGDNINVDARQQVLVVDADAFKQYTKEILRQKREKNGEPENDEADERIAGLVVSGDEEGA